MVIKPIQVPELPVRRDGMNVNVSGQKYNLNYSSDNDLSSLAKDVESQMDAFVAKS